MRASRPASNGSRWNPDRIQLGWQVADIYPDNNVSAYSGKTRPEWEHLNSDIRDGLVERGRSDLLLKRIERSWATWRGRAAEPVIRESLLRFLPDDRWPSTEALGGWWNRQNNPEIDLVGADREPVARHIGFLGSIKWLESQPFGHREYDTLVRDMLAVPGAEPVTPLVAVSRCGVAGRAA